MQNYRKLPSGTVARARQLRRDRTEAEDRLWYALREQLPAHKWRFQTPFHPYYADFVCMKARLVIEVDGGQHDEQRGYDERRTRHFETLGYQVLRFWNHDVLGNTDGVISQISLSLREKEGAAQRRKGEGEQNSSPSPDLASLGHPLPMGEGE